jgi:hypothetical protein
MDCHNFHSGIYGQSTSRHKICIISTNYSPISCRAEGLGRSRGTPSRALGAEMIYFVFSVINSMVKYLKNSLKTGPTGIFFGG